MILAGDIGGTKTNVALFRPEGGALVPVRQRTYRSAAFPTLWPLLEDFLGEDRSSVRAAAFGVAGPVVSNRVSTPNLAWSEIDGVELALRLGVERVDLLNDLVATALGVGVLPASSVVRLQQGSPQPEGAVAVIAAGTGLGMSALLPSPQGPVAMPSEGGHIGFAPRDALEDRLLAFMRAEIGGRVSVERVVSGMGIWAIYRFLRDAEGLRESPEVRARLDAIAPERLSGDAGGIIGESAVRCPLCEATLELFVSAYGSVAADLALMTMATGGVFVAGGIAPRHLQRISSGGFMTSFLNKGRYRQTLQVMPVSVVLEPETALLGAARRAHDRFSLGSSNLRSR